VNAYTKQTSKVEVLGLQELEKSGAVKTPRILSFSKDKLRLEFIESGFPTKEYWENLARTLVRLHRIEKPFFGWHQDGFIGKNPQINTQEKTWSDFFIKHRLEFQINLLTSNVPDSVHAFEKAKPNIREILEEVDEKPVLLHGDLWIGNVLCDKNQRPIFIDPSVYYGHRETDLAMMKLFGGFSDQVFDVYHQEYPLKPGWEKREKIYQLYHVLNHANLFGSYYLSQALSILRTLE